MMKQTWPTQERGTDRAERMPHSVECNAQFHTRDPQHGEDVHRGLVGGQHFGRPWATTT